MGRDLMGLFRRFYGHRMAYGDVIPQDARVDPAEFPEQEFPLHCPDCDYSLRGLPQDRCPECGHEFERGRLLVQQYVIERGQKQWRRTSRYAKWTGVCGLLLLVALFVLGGIVAFCLDPATMGVSMFGSISNMMRVFTVAMASGCVLFFSSTVLSAWLSVLSERKCKAVFEGIDRDVPSFRSAQKYKWVFWLIPVGLITWEVWDAWSNRADWFRYWAESPARSAFLATIGLGVGFALVIAIFIGMRFWDRRNNDTD